MTLGQIILSEGQPDVKIQERPGGIRKETLEM
jgi:hypothetical protein